MDELQECARGFEKLLDKNYHIIIGRKGKSQEVQESVKFSMTAFLRWRKIE